MNYKLDRVIKVAIWPSKSATKDVVFIMSYIKHRLRVMFLRLSIKLLMRKLVYINILLRIVLHLVQMELYRYKYKLVVYIFSNNLFYL